MSQDTTTPDTTENEHKCGICLEAFKHDYELIGYGCCAFKLCVTCDHKVKMRCPQCRTIVPSKMQHKLNMDFPPCRMCPSEGAKPAQMISQACRRIYDSVIDQRYTLRRKYFTGTKNYCQLHLQHILKRLESYGCSIDIRTNDMIEVSIGYDICRACDIERIDCICVNPEIAAEYVQEDYYDSKFTAGFSQDRIYEKIYNFNEDEADEVAHRAFLASFE
jgi:hypothetical protein